MVKKNPENNKASVSKLPVELSDAPLVIDLPDGQKIILSKLQEGAVIEVATWHGTGRPDSRTNRFMLGMTTGQTADTPTNSSPSVDSKPKPLGKSGQAAMGKLDGLMKTAKSFISNASQPLKAALNKTKELAPVDSTTDLEINAWLDSLKSEAKAMAETPVKSTTTTKKPSKRTVKKSVSGNNSRK
jgi:hypothetical protein